MKLSFTVLILVGLVASELSFSHSAYAKGAKPKSDSHRVLDFEDDVVEALNRKPLDSLNQISESGDRKRPTHLYQKRDNFKSETRQMLEEARYN